MSMRTKCALYPYLEWYSNRHCIFPDLKIIVAVLSVQVNTVCGAVLSAHLHVRIDLGLHCIHTYTRCKTGTLDYSTYVGLYSTDMVNT